MKPLPQGTLSMAQEFQLTATERSVSKVSRKELEEQFLALARLSLLQQNMIKEFAKEWLFPGI